MLLPSLVLATAAGVAPSPQPELDPAAVERFAQLALACVHQEYPNKISHVLGGPDDVRSPRELTPAFFGCYDWHSSVHGPWLPARLAPRVPVAALARPARRPPAFRPAPDHT